MKIDIEIQPESSEIRVVLYAPEISNEVQEIINNLKRKEKKRIMGIKDERLYILNLEDIFYFYSEDSRILFYNYFHGI